MRILLTGASGFIGNALAWRLKHLGHELTIMVHDNEPSFEVTALAAQTIRGSIECFDDCRRAVMKCGPEYVFHLAAQALVERARRDMIGTMQTNVQGTWNIIEAVRCFGRADLNAIICASSDKAYGEMRDEPYKEDDPLDGRGVYDASKSAMDLICRAMASENVPIRIARMGNVYGPGDKDMSRIVPSIMADIVNDRNPVIRSDGSPIRDYLFIDDAVDAYTSFLDYHADHEFRAFNFAGGQPVSVLELVKMALEVGAYTHLKPDVRGTRLGEIQKQVLNISRAKEELRWTPKTDLRVGLWKTWQNAMDELVK